jgi:hypothetical protein
LNSFHPLPSLTSTCASCACMYMPDWRDSAHFRVSARNERNCASAAGSGCGPVCRRPGMGFHNHPFSPCRFQFRSTFSSSNSLHVTDHDMTAGGHPHAQVGATALLYAVERLHPSAVTMLLAAKADPNQQFALRVCIQCVGRRALAIALQFGFVSPSFLSHHMYAVVRLMCRSTFFFFFWKVDRNP